MTFLRELARSVAWGLSALVVLAIGGFGLWWWLEEGVTGVSDGVCNIAIVPISGDIMPYPYTSVDEYGYTWSSGTDPDTFSSMLRMAEEDWYIQGVLVRIDSGGGTPAASEAISKTIQRSTLPSVALIRETGASGAYLAATGANTIIASRFSDVGSIGVSMSYLDNVIENESLGLTWNSLTSAQFKDYGSPDKPLTDEERALLERDLAIWHDAFVRQVALNRNMPLEQVQELADGSSLPGELALERGLVDAIGDQETAREWFAQELGMDVEDIIFCE